MMEEIWKDIEGYEGLYQVSNFGRVRSLDRTIKIGHKLFGNMKLKGRLFKQQLDEHGYYRVGFKVNNKQKNFQTARLVAAAFIPNPLNKPQVNHIDGKPKNNHVDNLEWCTQSENNIHAYKHKLRVIGEHHIEVARKRFTGANNPSAKVSAEMVKEIRQLRNAGWRLKRISKKVNVSISYISALSRKPHWTEKQA
jgi:hypothetical protein